MSARNLVLSQIQKALKLTALPGVPSSKPLVPGRQVSGPTLVDRFVSEVTALGVGLTRVSSAAELEKGLLETLAPHLGKSLLAWGDEALPHTLSPLLRKHFTLPQMTLPEGGEGRGRILQELGRAPVGITGADGALADTGTLMLLGGPGRARVASLLPPLHIALLKSSDIYPDMVSCVRAQQGAMVGASHNLFITGPSRTSDIELTLTIGVHGPKALKIFLLDF